MDNVYNESLNKVKREVVLRYDLSLALFLLYVSCYLEVTKLVINILFRFMCARSKCDKAVIFLYIVEQ